MRSTLSAREMFSFFPVIEDFFQNKAFGELDSVYLVFFWLSFETGVLSFSLDKLMASLVN